MNPSIFANIWTWLLNHKPDVAILVLLIYGSVRLTLYVNTFDHRLDRLEELHADIQTKQLPEIRDEIRKVKIETQEIKKEIVEIKLFMKKIDTYLSTTQKDYKAGE